MIFEDMQRLVPLRKQDFDAFYRILQESFPPQELRSRQEHLRLLDRQGYQVYACYAGQHLLAFLTVWEHPQLAFVEHFAVAQSHRNQGLGGRLLGQLQERLGKRLCLEAELPETEIACRRLGFYQRNGFYVNRFPYEQPPLEPWKAPVPLHLLTTDACLTQAEFAQVRHWLYTVVYAGKTAQ